MTAGWAGLTEGQAILAGIVLVVTVWVLLRVYDEIRDGIRRRRGLPTADHCEHCEQVEELISRVDALAELVVPDPQPGPDVAAMRAEYRPPRVR